MSHVGFPKEQVYGTYFTPWDSTVKNDFGATNVKYIARLRAQNYLNIIGSFELPDYMFSCVNLNDVRVSADRNEDFLLCACF